jgi:hypothetical protein
VWSFWAEVSSARKAARASAFPVAKADDGIFEARTKLSEAEAKSFEEDRLFLQGLWVEIPGANPTQSGSACVMG